jgi:peptidoglycan/LPS O-acetylase OafA/YrhL
MHVLAFHNHLDALIDFPEGIRSIIRTGYVSVSLFFILSGFILAYTYHADREGVSFDRRSFWVARLARIYPVYLVGLLLAAPFVFWAHFNSDRPAWSAFKILVLGGSCGTLTQSWVPPLAVEWNAPGWSLSAEAFFYLIFPFISPWIWRWNQRQTVLALAGLWLLSLCSPALCCCAGVAGFSDCPATVAPSSGWLAKLVAYNPLLRFPEFLLGIALCRLFVLKRQSRLTTASSDRLIITGRHHKSSFDNELKQEATEGTENIETLFFLRCLRCLLFLFSLAKKHFLPAIALIGIVGALGCGGWIPYPFLHNGLLDILFAALIYGLANVDSGSGLAKTPARLLSMPVFVLLGEASYAVYILHVPLRKWMYQILEWVNPNVHPSMAIFVAYTLVTLGISVLVFKLIEEPARRIIRRKLAYASPL